MNDFIFEYPMEVRDYECDLQGIVNNANYLHYMEHTRHQFLHTENVDFAQLHARGVDCVVARVDISYKTPLRSGDRFTSRLKLKKEGPKFVFHQTLYRLPDMKLVARAKVDTVCLKDGVLTDGGELNDVFGIYLTEQ